MALAGYGCPLPYSLDTRLIQEPDNLPAGEGLVPNTVDHIGQVYV